ncbi:MAG: enoyl-CoA hydratase [Brevibacterium aurantiacum]|uniref:Enoyl-CoA hydratase domain-containing protein 3, mitochondrial n=1 Tax=Brevibacterium aurantiacum TaxID=273384 RepID=A0A1D7W8J3_BREAU|nr:MULTISPECIES: enoyl-CoA hydratase [Brevibacterium]MDN5549575.1 enoyl-CoA hydratase [Brevibacterium sp.]AOP55292.1 Enoyl-CoA hydratase [Brevibacterium aurantiacum]AZL07176.1 enoyl-CoA hydratase [Brevibacterium aurantiacum]AZL10781.1 enoyl-CoA hydratase [Brevibacterium aurantiacum]AZL14395.1 enoyl-CoA hydratase [Brevibacterium aurantiacum]
MSDSIVFSLEKDAVATISINEPQTRNALSRSVMKGLIDTLAEVGQRTDVRAVILSTAGHVFSSGHDLKEISGAKLESQQETFALCSELMQLIQSIPQPVIAQVQGVATAAGCQLVASCDLAVAAASARFATPGVKIGLFCSTPMVALTRAVPAKTAMRMLLTGDFLSADDALSFGLVSDVVADDELEASTLELARKVASASSATVAIGKAAFYEQRDLPLAEAYEHMSEVMAHNAVAADAQEGIDAFLTRREPRWQHRD